MNSQAWTFLGTVASVLGVFVVAVYRTRATGNSEGRSASASEVVALGQRLDTQGNRLDELERRERVLREYIADDHVDHRVHGWPIRPVPTEIA